jgi:hypothetical protein
MTASVELTVDLLEGELFEGPAHHDLCGDSGPGDVRGLGHKRGCAGGSRIDLEDVDLAVLDGHLDVHKAADGECLGELAGDVADSFLDFPWERIGGDGARRVAGVDAGVLDVLHDAADHRAR